MMQTARTKEFLCSNAATRSARRSYSNEVSSGYAFERTRNFTATRTKSATVTLTTPKAIATRTLIEYFFARAIFRTKREAAFHGTMAAFARRAGRNVRSATQLCFDSGCVAAVFAEVSFARIALFMNAPSQLVSNGQVVSSETCISSRTKADASSNEFFFGGNRCIRASSDEPSIILVDSLFDRK